MSDGLLGNLLVKIIGDKSDLDKALSDSEKAADKTSKSISGNLKSQFKDIDAALGGIGSKVSRLLANPIVLATAAVVGLTKAFADTTKELVKYGSEINDTAEQTGLSTDALQEYKFAAEQTGGSLSSITNAVKIMTRGLDTQAATYASLGVAVKDANGQFRSANDIFDDTVAALGGIKNETERSKIALELFGRNAQELIPILNLGSGGLEELKQNARDLGLVMSEKTIKAADDLGDSTAALSAAWKAYTMSIVKDSLPAINGLTEALLNVAKAKQLGDEYAQSFKDIKAYQAGKKSITEYHAALLAMIEADEKYAASTDKSMNAQLNKAAAQKELIDLRKKLADLEASAEYKAAKAAEDRAVAEKSNAAITSAALAAQIEAENKQIAARKAAQSEYDVAIAKIKTYVAEGLYTQEQATEETTAAIRAYAEALITAGYSSNEASIGGRALKQALIDLRAQGIEPAIQSHENLAAAAIATMNAAIAATEAEVTIMEQAGAEKREELDRQLQAEEAAAEKRKQYLDITKSGLASVSDSFVALGAAIAEGENPVKAFFKTLIGTIGDTIIAFAGLVEAQGWATWPIVDWAKVIKGAGLAILGGTVKGLAASLAQGGIADQPTLAVVGDNPRAAEMVTPLTTEAYQNFAEGMLSALAERSRPAGITEATVASATVSGSSGAGSTINLHVGTLIADDAGMRKLNRELRKFGLQENVRTGYGG